MVMFFKPVQNENVSVPIEVTLSGIVILVKLLHFPNALLPIYITIFLSMVDGMAISPPLPVYFVMVTVLLLFTMYSKSP